MHVEDPGGRCSDGHLDLRYWIAVLFQILSEKEDSAREEISVADNV